MSYRCQPMGDYKTYGYAGDPGFLSSLWKGVKAVGKALFKPAVSFLPTPQQFPYPPARFPGVDAPPYGPGAPYPRVSNFPGGGRMTQFGPRVPSAPGQFALPSPGQMGVEPGCCPVGFHPRKDKRLPFKCVRNRRMNVANPRALRRGMRRVQGFEKLARRTISFTKRVRIKKKPS